MVKVRDDVTSRFDNESSRQPVQLDKALKSHPRSPYPTATFDFDHHKPRDSQEEDNDVDMDTDVGEKEKVLPPRHVPVHANTIAVPNTHASRGRDRTIKALGSHSGTMSVGIESTSIIEQNTIMTPVATSTPLSIVSASTISASSKLDTVEVPITVVLSPKSVASNTSIISGISGTSLRNDFWQSLSFEEGLQEEDEEGLGEEGASPPPKLTSSRSGTVEKIQVNKYSRRKHYFKLTFLSPPKLGKEIDMTSRPNFPMLLGTKDGDISRWPDTTSGSAFNFSVSHSSQLVDIPLSPFDPPHAQVL
ncbi:hypothetical protein K435DRAFT_840015 [Dendrothele bispora CBS 962.96]|uniref:Uncharacterized protein n=1 Tax=Dendrothele bispora (strain CBS 962.96) TaxID=1314807 RepID=A0A4S8LWG0_DENBC|nr:hypothetical protein K435DRAFT_840015 [Dendrothele bispora CBS 962.96]